MIKIQKILFSMVLIFTLCSCDLVNNYLEGEKAKEEYEAEKTALKRLYTE